MEVFPPNIKIRIIIIAITAATMQTKIVTRKYFLLPAVFVASERAVLYFDEKKLKTELMSCTEADILVGLAPVQDDFSKITLR